MAGSNYPPGVTGSEPEIVGDPSGDEANFGSVRQRIRAALATLQDEGEISDDAIQYELERALEDLETIEDEMLAEPDVEEIDETTTTELDIRGEFDDLRILEIPLEAEHATNLLGRPYDVPRYAVLGVPKAVFTESDRSDVQRILYSVRIQKTKPEVEEPISPFEQESKR